MPPESLSQSPHLITPVKQRAGEVLKTEIQENNGYYYPDQYLARLRMQALAGAARRGLVICDVDDTLTPTAEETMAGINETVGVRATLRDLRGTSSGRYFEIPQYKAASENLGGFAQVIKPYLGSKEFHAGMIVRQNALRFLRQLAEKDIVVVSYISGRPSELTQVTCQWLAAYGFPEAPVWCMTADPRLPSKDKPGFIDTVYPWIRKASNVPVYLLDDDIRTALEVRDVIPVVPLLGRNSDPGRVQQLQDNGVLHGVYGNDLLEQMLRRSVGV